ncbi:HAD family phosphatase [Prolixibacteraceae bacterium JC049]|nr:HAD family phosphatase [Prolixibacteraceae bacterium JC049]
MAASIHKAKNIIFDLGGVLLNLNIHNSLNAFIELGYPPVVHIDELVTHESPFGQLERGELSPTDFIEAVKNMLPNGTTSKQVETAWCAMLLDIPANRVDALKKLKETHQLYLYSNTNAIHAQYFESKFFQMYGFELATLFNKVYYSHEVGYRKPSPEGFQRILSENHLIPVDTIFVDDLQPNLDAAKQLGMQTLLIDPKVGFTLK